MGEFRVEKIQTRWGIQTTTYYTGDGKKGENKVLTGPMEELCYPIAEGVSAMISCIGGPPYGEGERDGKPFLVLDTQDFAPITPFQFDDSVEFIKRHIVKGNVQVVCQEGHSRSRAIALAYDMGSGLSYDDAMRQRGAPACLVHFWSLVRYAHKKGYIDDATYEQKMRIINKARGQTV